MSNADLNSIKVLYRVGNVNCTAQVEAVGYKFNGLKFNSGATEKPIGGISSAPVKKVRTFGRVTISSNQQLWIITATVKF